MYSKDPISQLLIDPTNTLVTGCYRTSHRCAIVATQAAGSRLFEVRNPTAATLHVPLRLQVKWGQTAAHTAAIEDSLDVFRNTSFSAVDTVNTVTPTVSVKRTAGMVASPNAVIRGVTVAGAAAGMTGGTRTPDGNAIDQLPLWLTLSFADPQRLDFAVMECFFNDALGCPFAFAQNEGFEIQNRVLLGAAAGSSVYISYSWVELTAP